VQNKDRYGRTVADVWLNTRWINLELVREGWAWMYRQYSKSPELDQAEQQARESKAGLWADKSPVPPWAYRHPKQVKPKEPGLNTPQPLFKTEW
jgi:endonuclease YncB( thermonuclease family)